MRDLTIRSRVIGAFLAILVLVAGARVVAVQGLQKAKDSYERAIDGYSEGALVGAELKAALLEQVRAQKNYVLREEPRYLEEAQRHDARAVSLRARLGAAASGEDERMLLGRFDAAETLLRDAFEESVRVRRSRGIEAADVVMRGKAAAAAGVLDEMIALVVRRAGEARAEAARQYRHTLAVTEILGLSIAVLAVLLGVAVSLSIVWPLRRLQAQITQLTRDGVVPTAPAVQGRSAVADIARAFHELVQKASLIRELEARSSRLAALSARVTQGQEEERARIAQELHDGLGQALTAVKMDLSAAGRQLGPEASATRKRVVAARKLIDESLHELRRLVFDLRPAVLDTLGVAAAVEGYARDWQERMGVPVTVDADRFEPRLPPEVETALYRICQEALTNVAKHAGASRVMVRVGRLDDRAEIVVEDDGVGFNRAASLRYETAAAGVGLLSMEQRVAGLGGVLEIESAPGKGTRVQVLVPVQRERGS